jgi:hypothetical protein
MSLNQTLHCEHKAVENRQPLPISNLIAQFEDPGSAADQVDDKGETRYTFVANRPKNSLKSLREENVEEECHWEKD